MENNRLKPGDVVTYCDRDQLVWGPWKVVDVADHSVTVAVDNRVSVSGEMDLFRKVGDQRILA